MKILACQIDIPSVVTAEQRDAHVRRIATRIGEHIELAGGVDLVLLPELSTISYSKEAFENLDELAEDLHGPSTAVFSKTAQEIGAYVCFGLPRQADDNTYRISQIVIDGKGQLVGHYDKIHLAGSGEAAESSHFSPGHHLLVFDVAGVRTAPIICYDQRFPELARTLVVEHGVDLLLHPVAFHKDSTFPSWHPFVITRALENQVHLLSLNQAGDDCGASIFSPPGFDDARQPLVFPDEEIFRILEVDCAYTAQTRRNNSYREDRINNYADLPLL